MHSITREPSPNMLELLDDSLADSAHVPHEVARPGDVVRRDDGDGLLRHSRHSRCRRFPFIGGGGGMLRQHCVFFKLNCYYFYLA